ncbi:hypothetical protein HDV05_003475 [Chytridiales sp. JEL 0842]|nr:hypothetical protein HDV05_003475 [Chytridiales sp. JEL 0842]
MRFESVVVALLSILSISNIVVATPVDSEGAYLEEREATVELAARQGKSCKLPTCYPDPESIAADMKYCDYVRRILPSYNPCTDRSQEPSTNDRCIAPFLGERYGVMPFTMRSAPTAPAMTGTESACWARFNATTTTTRPNTVSLNGAFDCLRAAQMVLQYGKSTITVRVGRGQFTSYRPATFFVTRNCQASTGVSFTELINHFMKKKRVVLQFQFRIPFASTIQSFELKVSTSDKDKLGKSVGWLRRQCADREHARQDCVVLFNLTSSSNVDEILTPTWLDSVPENVDELQFENPERVEDLVPGAIWLDNPFEALADLKRDDNDLPKLMILAVLAEKPDELPGIHEHHPPQYHDHIRVATNYVTSNINSDIDNLAISSLEAPLPDNHASHTAQVFGLLPSTTPTATPSNNNRSSDPEIDVNLIALTQLSYNLQDAKEKLLAPPEFIHIMNAKAADYLESHLPDGHESFAAGVLQLEPPSSHASFMESMLISLPTVPAYAIFRDEDLQTLKTELETHRAVCIIGELGLGKTLLATQYAWKNCDQYDWVFFISCSSMKACMNGFRGLLEATNMKHQVESASDDIEVAKSALEWLKDHSNYLLIIDTTDNLDVMKSTFSNLSYHIGGHVIITSRDSSVSTWASRAFFSPEKTVPTPTLTLPLWTRLDTITYLKHRVPFLPKLLKRDGEQDYLNDICENFLSDYPIIIEQFATLLIQSGRFNSLKIIARWLSSSGHNQLLETAADGHSGSFLDHFKRALESLIAVKDIGPLSVFLICIIGTFSSAPLPLSVFKESFNLLIKKLPEAYGGPTFKDCLHSLRSSAFLKSTDDNDSENITIHKVFHQLALPFGWTVLEENCATLLEEVRLSKEDLVDICWAASTTLVPATTCYTSYDFTIDVQKACTSMTPHLTHLSQHERQSVPFVACLERVGWIHYTSMRIQNAKPAMERALELRVIENGSSRISLACANIMESLGCLCLSLGDFKAGESLLNEAFDTKVKICGTKEAEPLIVTYERLAHLKRTQKQLPEAVELCKEALEVIQKVRGDLRSDSAQYLQMILGEVLIIQDKLEGVFEIFEEALETCRILDDPYSALNLMNCIAKVHLKKDDFEKALEVYQKVRKTSVELYGTEKHIVPAASLHTMGLCYRGLGEYHKAFELNQQYLDALVDVYGSLKAERVANTIFDTGNCLFSLGQYDAAIEKYQLSQTLFAEMGQEGSVDVADAKFRESVAQAVKGNVKTALRLVEESMATFSEKLQDDENVFTMKALHFRGHFKRLLGDFDGARSDLQLCLEKKIDFYKKREDQNVATTIIEMGCLLRDEGKHDEALEMVQEGVEIQLRVLAKKEVLQNVEGIFELALALKSVGNLEDAKWRFEESLELLYKIFGRDYKHPKMAEIRKELDLLVENPYLTVNARPSTDVEPPCYQLTENEYI